MSRSRRGRIPDRWVEYSNIGKLVPNTRFLPFKVPLKEETFDDFDNQFTTKVLRRKVPDLKLIIDLTNTGRDRYYNARDFTKHGISVVKVKCPGNGPGPARLPPKYLLDQFYEVIDKFLNENPVCDSVIGVHCTHGLNRTGYFICKYMTERMGIKSEKAIESFEIARGHKMERPNYINDILRVRRMQNF